MQMLGEAFLAMSANRLRTFLTMLGMMIGVGAVVLMMAIGEGAQAVINRSISSMGSNLFIVLAGTHNASGARTGAGNAISLKIDDAIAISELDGVAASAPVTNNNAQVIYAGNNWNTTIAGVTPDYFQVREWDFEEGFAFTESDVRSATRVAIIGKTVANNLFGEGVDPVGKSLRIKQSPFIVLGVLESKGQSLEGRDQDDVILVPITTAQRALFGSQISGSIRMIIVKAESDDLMPMVESGIVDLLRQRHRLREGVEDDFTVRNLTALANAAAETTRTMSMLLGSIASISLLVGGIGIMNIMLVSVTERTREIGIRMAIGARQIHILMQFMLEAIALSIVGCLIGISIGVGGAFAVEEFMGTEVSVSVLSISVAFAVAAAIGIFFGFYPAYKASKLNPIEALRYI